MWPFKCDPNLRVLLTFPKTGVARLTIDYPRLPEYRDKVYRALSGLVETECPEDMKTKGNAEACANA